MTTEQIHPVGTLLSRKEYATKMEFTHIYIWNGSEWISDYKWDLSNCHDFGTNKAATAFSHKCIFEAMAKLEGHSTAKFGTTTIERRATEFNCVETKHFNNVDRSDLP